MRGSRLPSCTQQEYNRPASQRCPTLPPCANGVWTLLTSPSPAPCGRPSTPLGTFRHCGWRLPSLPAACVSIPSRATLAQLPSAWSRALLPLLGDHCKTPSDLTFASALNPSPGGEGRVKGLPGNQARVTQRSLLGERPASSSAAGEGSSGQPSPTHPHAPVLAHSSPRVPTPSPCPAAAAQPTPNVPIQDHPTRSHRGHIQATTGHISPQKWTHPGPKTGHIRQKSGHIGSDGVEHLPPATGEREP